MDRNKSYKKIASSTRGRITLLLGAASLLFQACGSQNYSSISTATTSQLLEPFLSRLKSM